MRTTPLLVAFALVLAFSAVPATAQDAGATLEGHCNDSAESGGGGSVGADSDGNVDATNESEAESIVAGLQDLDDGSCDESADLRLTVSAAGEEESHGYSDYSGNVALP